MSDTDNLINNIVAKVASKYYVRESTRPSLNKFQMIRDLSNFKLLRSYIISTNGLACTVLFTSYTVESYQQRAFPFIPRIDESLYVYAILGCRKDFGRISVRPKTLLDKINSFLAQKKNNLLTENKFNSSFETEVENVEKAKLFFKKDLVNLLMLHNKIIIEIVGREILIRSGLKSASEEDLIALLKLVFDLALLIEKNEQF